MKNSREIINKRAHLGTWTHNSHLWGVISTISGHSLHEETADDNQELHPRATEVLYNDFYAYLLSGPSTQKKQCICSTISQHCSNLQASHPGSGRLTTPHFWMLFRRNFKTSLVTR